MPSIIEGVGLTALEAAHYGCDIVITNIGGPKEYYGDYAYLVNPYNIDDIGQQIVNALNSTKQPSLKEYLNKTSSMEVTIDLLERSYKELI
ncbi:MAG: glycosyltransferase [Muribaculum sp.]|nr:glycosyltransferase [Muribaculum sp.]